MRCSQAGLHRVLHSFLPLLPDLLLSVLGVLRTETRPGVLFVAALRHGLRDSVDYSA